MILNEMTVDSVFAGHQENGRFRSEIVESARAADAFCAVADDADRIVDPETEFVAEVNEIPHCTQMNIGRVVPVMAERACNGHAA
jgi:hypothetical protein